MGHRGGNEVHDRVIGSVRAGENRVHGAHGKTPVGVHHPLRRAGGSSRGHNARHDSGVRGVVRVVIGRARNESFEGDHVGPTDEVGVCSENNYGPKLLQVGPQLMSTLGISRAAESRTNSDWI